MSAYQGRDFYEVFGVRKDASLKEIQRAYRVLALRAHPDRNGNSPESIRDFQEISRMMEILGDPRQRSIYDLSGDNQDLTNARFNADEVFVRVTEADIDSYAASYLGSEEEERDVLDAYDKYEGRLEKMLEWIPLSDPSYLPRYRDIVDKHAKFIYKNWAQSSTDAKTHHDKYAAEADEAETLKEALAKKYKKHIPKAIKRRSPERDEDEKSDQSPRKRGSPTVQRRKRREQEKELVPSAAGGVVPAGLMMGMRAREKARHEKMVRDMEQRYGKGGGKKPSALPTEREFQRIQRQLDRHKRDKRVKRD